MYKEHRRQGGWSACHAVRADRPGCRRGWSGGQKLVVCRDGLGSAVGHAPVRNDGVCPTVWGGSGQGGAGRGPRRGEERRRGGGQGEGALLLFVEAAANLLPAWDTVTLPGTRSSTLAPSGGANAG